MSIVYTQQLSLVTVIIIINIIINIMYMVALLLVVFLLLYAAYIAINAMTRTRSVCLCAFHAC